MVIADKFQQCSPSISNSYNSCGTITRTSLKSLTVAQLVTTFQDGSGNYRDMTSLLKNSFELKACGVRQNGLYDFLMSSAKGQGKLVNKRNIAGSESYIEPFIFGRQKSIINDDYWALSTSYPVSGGGAYVPGTTGALSSLSASLNGTTVAGTRVIRVLSRVGIDVGNEFFPATHKMHVFSRDGSTGEAQKTQWRILASAANTSTIDVLVVEQDSGSSTPHNATATAGYAIIGSNDVADWESFCLNRPALNPNKLVPFFFETSRTALCVDSNYKEYLAKALETNELFGIFGDVPLAERNRQIGERAQREWLNSFFWQKPLVNQAISTYTSLEQIKSIAGTVMGYRANSVGVYEQLRACGRVTDWMNGQLYIKTLLADLYQVVRARKQAGMNYKSVDIYTDTSTAELFKRGMLVYYNNQSGGLLRYNAPITDGDIEGSMQQMGFWATSYKVDYPAGLVINIVTHEFFDDLVSVANAEGIASTGRFLWVLDLGGSIYPGIIGSSRVSTTVDQIDLLRKVNTSYSCVISNPTRDLTLNSTTWTTIVECPAVNLIYENFSADVPDGVNIAE